VWQSVLAVRAEQDDAGTQSAEDLFMGSSAFDIEGASMMRRLQEIYL
jgi:hypothetical protein